MAEPQGLSGARRGGTSDLSLCSPRPQRSQAHQQSRGDDVCRPSGRDGTNGRALLPRRLGAQHGVMARGRGSLADATGDAAARGEKRGFIFPSMLPLLSSPLEYFFSPTFFGRCVTWPRSVWRLPVALGPRRLQRPSIRAGATPVTRFSLRLSTRAGRPVGRRPHLSDGFFAGPGSTTGRLHQHQGRGLTQHRQTAYASLRTAPSGKTPVSRKRHRAMSNLRATATIPMRLKRLPPPPKRSRNQQLRHSQAGNGPNSRPTPWSSSARADS